MHVTSIQLLRVVISWVMGLLPAIHYSIHAVRVAVASNDVVFQLTSIIVDHGVITSIIVDHGVVTSTVLDHASVFVIRVQPFNPLKPNHAFLCMISMAKVVLPFHLQ